MKKLILFILSAAILAQPASAVIAPETVWEINSAGSMNSSAGFNPANANMPTDLTTDASTGNTASPVVSSASYNFVAGDVNHYVYIKAGTNWIPGWYQIASVASNKATLSAAIGAAQLANYSDNTAAGVASVGTPTGGTWAIDYSRSPTARFSGTDLECADGDATSPVVTSASTPFGKSHVANLIKISAGANYTLRTYEIVSVSGLNATLDRAVALVDGPRTGGTFYVGGSANLLTDATGTYPSLDIAGGNTTWIKGTISTSTAQSMPGVGSATAPTRYTGYATKRGDGYLGRTGSGVLVTTNCATFTFSGSARITAAASYGIISNLSVSAAVDNYALATSSTNNLILNCVVTNSSTGANAGAIAANNTNNSVINCDASMTGGSGAASGAAVRIDTGLRLIGCRIDGGPTTGVIGAGNSQIINNVIFDCGLQGILLNTATPAMTIYGNTIVNCGQNGILLTTSTTGLPSIVNNMITDCAAWGIDLVTASVPISIVSNRFRGNASGNIRFPSAFSIAATQGSVNDTGAALSDYTNAATGDFTPVPGSPAVNAGLLDTTIGAVQRDQSGSGSATEKSHTFVQ